MLDRIRRMFVNGSGLLIVIFAALLLELLSAAQYYLTHQLMEEELEKRSEGELRLKAVLIKSTLNSTESILRDFVWKFQSHLEEPDSAAMTVLRMAKLGSHLQGVAIGFDPYYYPEKGKWYEPYARRGANGEVVFDKEKPSAIFSRGLHPCYCVVLLREYKVDGVRAAAS